jgi:hypothetical protein
MENQEERSRVFSLAEGSLLQKRKLLVRIPPLHHYGKKYVEFVLTLILLLKLKSYSHLALRFCPLIA